MNMDFRERLKKIEKELGELEKGFSDYFVFHKATELCNEAIISVWEMQSIFKKWVD